MPPALGSKCWYIWRYSVIFHSRIKESYFSWIEESRENHQAIQVWKWKSLSHVQLFVTPWTIQSMEFCRPEYFSRGSSQVSHIASTFFTTWATREAQEYWSGVAYPFSSGSSWHRNWTGVSCIADGFFTNWAIMEAKKMKCIFEKYQGQETQWKLRTSSRLKRHEN